MFNLKPYIHLFSTDWKDKYGAILAEEHLSIINRNLYAYQLGENRFELPFFKDEIKEDLSVSFIPFIEAFSLLHENELIYQLENISITHWLMVLGQRLTSASIRDERAIPPAKNILIKSCTAAYNSEITMAQRAWEKHIGRTTDSFWGEIIGNNQSKQEKVMKKIIEILDNTTWWNAFYHYKHGYVYEVREKDGHGIRWNLEGTQLIGFLEHFINE